MNYPRIDIYVTPYALEDLSPEKNVFGATRGIYTPPSRECEIICNLSDYSPTINAVTPPTGADVCGFAYCLGDDKFTPISKWPFYKKVFAIIWYQKPMSENDLEVIQHHFAPYFGIKATGRRIITRNNKHILENGCLEPPKKLVQQGGSFY